MAFRALSVLVFLCAEFVATGAAFAQPTNVHIDARKQAGAVPYAYRAGVFLNSLPIGYPKDTFLADQRPGMIELSWDYYPPLRDAATEDEFFARLPGSNLTAWVRDTAAAGGEPYIRLMPVPRWLWAGANGGRSPPADWRGWERFVERLVDYFNNRLRIDVRYIVWDEPDQFWEGTTDDYLQLYRHSAAGLLRANPKARIGGPAGAAFNAAIGKTGPPLLPTFVRYCATTSIPGVARRLPIDHLVWHTFGAAPISPGQYDLEVEAARKVLAEHGYRDSVELNIGSWTAMGQYPGLINPRDSNFLSAYVASSVIAMARAGVDRHAFFNLFEDWRRGRSEFSDELGLTTRNFVIKAGYHANTLLSRLQGQLVTAASPDPFLQSAAARDGDTLRILVSNFAPPYLMLRLLSLNRLMARGHARDSLRSLMPELERLFADRRQLEAWNVPADVRAEFLSLHDAMQRSTPRQREPLEIRLQVNGLPDGRYRVSEYRIDAVSGNAFARRQEIEHRLEEAAREGRIAAREHLSKRWSATEMAQFKSGGPDKAARLKQLPAERQQEFREAMAIQDAAAQRQAKAINSAAPPLGKFLSEVEIRGTHSLQIELPPYGVVLVELEKRK